MTQIKKWDQPVERLPLNLRHLRNLRILLFFSYFAPSRLHEIDSMTEPESRLPLIMGALFALLLHTALVPIWSIGLASVVGREPATPPKQDQPLPTPPELQPGQARDSVTNIAWIAYDDYRELLAQHAIVEQPALQKQQDPIPNAPIEFDPTPPAPNAQPKKTPTPPSTDTDASKSLVLPSSASSPVPLPTPADQGDMPYAPKGPTPRKADAVLPDTPDSPDQPDSPAKSPSTEPSSPGSPNSSAKPTAAPRDQAEAPPVTIMPGTLRVRPGKVETYQGIKINTVVPRPSAAAYFSAVPRNPKATLWFNNQGIVTRVDLTHSTGAKNWDEPVIAALEQWTAKGEKIDNLEGEIQLKIEILFNRE